MSQNLLTLYRHQTVLSSPLESSCAYLHSISFNFYTPIFTLEGFMILIEGLYYLNVLIPILSNG
jgi:hypothetical protein